MFTVSVLRFEISCILLSKVRGFPLAAYAKAVKFASLFSNIFFILLSLTCFITISFILLIYSLELILLLKLTNSASCVLSNVFPKYVTPGYTDALHFKYGDLNSRNKEKNCICCSGINTCAASSI